MTSANPTPPPPRDRLPLYIAIVGAIATITAAFVGILPALINRPTPPPTAVIVVTATPEPTEISLAASPPPTDTAPIPTAAPDLPTATPDLPTAAPDLPTVAPSPTATADASVATVPPFTPTRPNLVTLVLLNNLPRTMEFFVDNVSTTRITGGTFQPLKIPRGTHEFKQCVLGTDYNDPANCYATTHDLQPNPEVWVMYDETNPMRTEGNVNVVILNRANIPQDVFVDNVHVETVPPADFVIVPVSVGTHTLQPCAPGYTPPSQACGTAFTSEYSQPTHFLIINGESS